jgi:hypothetical protein
MQQALSMATAILARLESDVRQSGGRLAVAVLPSRIQVEPTLAEREHRGVADLLGLSEADLGLELEIARTMVERLAQANTPTLALLDPLRSASPGMALYYNRDWHLNVRGHQAVAEILARWLIEMGLLSRLR